MDITLTGFMGCGKSSVGRILPDLLSGFVFIDLDEFVEELAGKSVPSIFKEDGEAEFRRIECDALETIFLINEDHDRQCVISLGGGTVTTPDCRELVKEDSICVYLRASVETLTANLESDSGERPLLNSDKSLKERIEELMAERSSTYESVAKHIIDVDGKTYEQVAMEIAGLLNVK